MVRCHFCGNTYSGHPSQCPTCGGRRLEPYDPIGYKTVQFAMPYGNLFWSVQPNVEIQYGSAKVDWNTPQRLDIS